MRFPCQFTLTISEKKFYVFHQDFIQYFVYQGVLEWTENYLVKFAVKRLN